MRKGILAIAAFAMLASCGAKAKQAEKTNQVAEEKTSCACSGSSCQSEQTADVTFEDGLHVLYFHGAKRCPTCMSIEKNVQDLIKAQYAKQVADQKLYVHVIDYSKEPGKSLANQFQVSFSSLVLLNKQGDKVNAGNATRFAFSTSRRQPEVFKAGVAAVLDGALKTGKVDLSLVASAK